MFTLCLICIPPIWISTDPIAVPSRDEETEKIIRENMQGSVFSESETLSHGLVV